MNPSKVFRSPRQEIRFAENKVSDTIQLFRLGTFYHPTYGKLEITSQLLAEMKKNFDDKARGVDIAVDYQHDNEDVAAGWIKELSITGDGMFAKVDWTPNGSKVLSDKEFRYISPEFTTDYTDNETLKNYGATLLGAALTNRPVIKKMEPVVELAESKPNDKLHAEQKARSEKYGIEIAPDGALTPPSDGPSDAESYGDPVNYKYPMADKAHAANAHARFKQASDAYKEQKSKNVVYERIVRRELALGITPSFDAKDPLDASLPSDLKSKLEKPQGGKKMADQTPEELKAQYDDLKKKYDELMAQHSAMAAEKQAMVDAAKCAEQEKTFEKLLKEGKLCAAQKEAFMKGDTVKLAELAQPVKLENAGNGGSGEDDKTKGKTPYELVKELALVKLNEKKAKTLHDAISLVLSERKDLSEQLYK